MEDRRGVAGDSGLGPMPGYLGCSWSRLRLNAPGEKVPGQACEVTS